MGIRVYADVRTKICHIDRFPDFLTRGAPLHVLCCVGTPLLLLPPGWDASPSQDTQHKVTRSISTPPGWDASPSQDTQHKVTRSIITPLWMGN